MNTLVIRKSNRLIEARYRLSLGEQRLILLLTSQISPDDEDFMDYQIRVNDFARMFDLKTDKSVYKSIEEAADKLLGKRLTLQDGEIQEATVWLSYVKYRKGVGVIEMRFDKSLKPYLLQLKSHFTQYQLKTVVHFKSQYSIRMYELLKAEEFKIRDGKFSREFTIEEYKIYLGIDEGEYTDFDNLRRRVIDPSMKEISEFSDLIVKSEYRRTGRKITHIVFNIERSRQTRLDLESGSPVIEVKADKNTTSLQSELFGLGIAEEKAKAMIAKYGDDRVRRNIDYFVSFRKTGATIKNPSGYLIDAIDKDYAIAQLTLENNQKDTVTKVRAEKEMNDREEKALAQLKKKQVSTIITAFDALPIDVQTNILDAFKTQLTDFARGQFVKFGHQHASQRYVFARYCIAPLHEQTGQIFELSMNS